MDRLAPSCALDSQGLERQRERYGQLAPSVLHLERAGDLLTVDFGPAFDRATLDEAIAVERECCPFFTFAFDEQQRRLQVGVDDAGLADALDGIGHALS